VTASRAEAVGRGLVEHLRASLGEPALSLAEPPRPLTGGFDTEIFTVRLRAAPAEFTGPLVLRVLRAHHDPGLVLREQAIQNALADQRYPAARVIHASLDPAPLGAAFLLMERLPGAPLISARPLGMERPLLDVQLRLHALDAAPLARALGEAVTFDGYVAALERRVARAGLHGLIASMRWLREHRPRPAAPPVICHGDLHPQNVLVEGRRVTGVLDWPNTVIADAAFDVASTRNILRFVPPTLVSLPRLLRWLASVGQPLLAARYLRGYRSQQALDADRLAYYEVAAAMRALVRAGERRARAGSDPPPTALDRSAYAGRLLAHVVAVTGLAAELPDESW
jgi:aminoglycoside phosphotransferase (APT) family kinase protein